jgi:hypothetical protein
MTPSWRKPVGMLGILLLILIWCVAITSLSGVVGSCHWLAQLVFYLFTGLIWITPMKPMLRWMEVGRWR